MIDLFGDECFGEDVERFLRSLLQNDIETFFQTVAIPKELMTPIALYYQLYKFFLKKHQELYKNSFKFVGGKK